MNEHALLKLLNEPDISFQYISHPEVKTVADHASFAADFPAQLLKNLLLKNSTGKHFYLYILGDSISRTFVSLLPEQKPS